MGWGCAVCFNGLGPCPRATRKAGFACLPFPCIQMVREGEKQPSPGLPSPVLGFACHGRSREALFFLLAAKCVIEGESGGFPEKGLPVPVLGRAYRGKVLSVCKGRKAFCQVGVEGMKNEDLSVFSAESSVCMHGWCPSSLPGEGGREGREVGQKQHKAQRQRKERESRSPSIAAGRKVLLPFLLSIYLRGNGRHVSSWM